MTSLKPLPGGRRAALSWLLRFNALFLASAFVLQMYALTIEPDPTWAYVWATAGLFLSAVGAVLAFRRWPRASALGYVVAATVCLFAMAFVASRVEPGAFPWVLFMFNMGIVLVDLAFGLGWAVAYCGLVVAVMVWAAVTYRDVGNAFVGIVVAVGLTLAMRWVNSVCAERRDLKTAIGILNGNRD